ncbi:MAG: LamG-like jellyroll fold domain-containing protein [Bacilli bacterium]
MYKEKSFTLIELLVVIVIIGILAGVIMISTSSSIDKANIAKSIIFADSVKNSLLTDLVAEWTFDGISGTIDSEISTVANFVADDWGTHNGTAIGSPILKNNNTCATKQCLSFNGSTDYIYVNDSADFDFRSRMSAFAWVRGDTQTKAIIAQYDYGNGQRSFLLRSNNNKLEVYISDNGTVDTDHFKRYTSTGIAFDNNWHHVGFTFDSGNLNLYIDGQVANVTKANDYLITSIYDSNAYLTIGSYLYNNALNSPFLGLIDDLHLYNTVLQTSQIKQNYIAGLDSLLSHGNISKEDYNQRINALAYNQHE